MFRREETYDIRILLQIRYPAKEIVDNIEHMVLLGVDVTFRITAKVICAALIIGVDQVDQVGHSEF